MKASNVKTKTPTSKPGTSLKDKFRSQKQDLMKRHQEQVDNKDQGNEFPTIFDKSKIPPGIGFWKCGKGDHLIDIIPFFAGSQNPRVPEGELSYVVDLWVHTNVGAMRTPYPCEAKNFKTSDPICEYISKNRLSKDEWKRVSSKRRTVYLIWVHDSPEEEKKGIQIWEVAHFFFEQHIDEIAKSPRGGGATAFSDIESGKSIAFSVKVTGKYKDGDTDRDSISYTGHRFADRDIDSIPTKILEQSFPLDECINMHPDFNEVEEAFLGSSTPKKYEESCVEEDDIPSKDQKVKKGNKRPEPEPEEEDIDDDGNDQSDEGDDDGTEIAEDEETENADDSQDEGDESETEEEVTECPHDPDSFGEVDEHDECEADGGCPLWDSCSDEANRRKKEEEIADAKKKKPLASTTKHPRKLGK